MKSTLLLICFCAVLSMNAVSADQASAGVLSQGETHVVLASGKSNVQVVVKTREVQIGKPSDPRPEIVESNCTNSRYPCSVVDLIGITVNGNHISIPRSTFADLADLNVVKIEVAKAGWILTFTGGDASESYIVKIEFDAGGVNKRTIFSGMAPDKPLEVTTYYELVIGDK